mmetsp:Transcript_45780/g.89457  ORF Transcript_45780/g.89457 Transcript_45780/m.89457 type:complete len:601 (+) Transcript_45780:993-2795(+)
MFVDGIFRERPGGVGAAGQDVQRPAHRDDIGRVSAPRALAVVGVHSPSLERRERSLAARTLVEGVGVDGHLDVVVLRHPQAAVDGGRRGAPVLVQFEPASPCRDGVEQPLRPTGVALASEAEIERQAVGGAHHHPQVAGRRRAGGGAGAAGRARAAPQHRGEAGRHGLVGELRTDEVHVCVHAARGKNEPLARDGLRVCSHDQLRRHAVHGVRVSRLADAGDVAMFDADIGLVDARVVEHEGVGDDRVQHLRRRPPRGLSHAVPDHLSPAELELVPDAGRGRARDEVPFHLHDERRVAQTDAVADGGPEDAGVGLPGQGRGRGRPDRRLLHVAEAQGGNLGHQIRRGRAYLFDGPVDEAVAAADHPVSGDGHEGDGLLLPRLEPHGGTGADVQTSPVRDPPVERQEGVALEKMVVAPHLDRTVRRVKDGQQNRLPPGVQRHRAAGGRPHVPRRDGVAVVRGGAVDLHLSGPPPERVRGRDRQERPVQRLREVPVVPGEGVVNRDQFRPVGESGFHLHGAEEVGDAGHDVRAAEQGPRPVHEVGDAELPVARPLHDVVTDERGRLRVAQQAAAGEAPLRQGTGVGEGKVIGFAGGQLHPGK